MRSSAAQCTGPSDHSPQRDSVPFQEDLSSMKPYLSTYDTSDRALSPSSASSQSTVSSRRVTMHAPCWEFLSWDKTPLNGPLGLTPHGVPRRCLNSGDAGGTNGFAIFSSLWAVTQFPSSLVARVSLSGYSSPPECTTNLGSVRSMTRANLGGC